RRVAREQPNISRAIFQNSLVPKRETSASNGLQQEEDGSVRLPRRNRVGRRRAQDISVVPRVRRMVARRSAMLTHLQPDGDRAVQSVHNGIVLGRDVPSGLNRDDKTRKSRMMA